MNSEMEESSGLSPIQTFYKDSTIFLTGATGFLGLVTLEKLFRCCSNISKIYILVRSKKGKHVNERLEEIFGDVVFDRLRVEFPKFLEKVFPIEGDCVLPMLGLSPDDCNCLINQVDIVLHLAATVRFDEKLENAIDINIKATKDIFLLAHQMVNLKCIMHVSTVFSNCNHRIIEETIYPSFMKYQNMLDLRTALPDQILDSLTSKFLQYFQIPNTYILTKQIAESVVEDLGKKLPCGIFRPSIVISSYKEPVTAWTNNLYGPMGVTAGASIGLLKTLNCNGKMNASVIPVDMCVNSLIAAAWEVGCNFQDKQENEDVPIYNFDSTNDQPINWETFVRKTYKYGEDFPPSQAVWFSTMMLQKNYTVHYITTCFLHMVPAFLVDIVLLISGKSPQMVKIYTKIHKLSSVLVYFLKNQWIVKSENVNKLHDRMSEVDKQLFFFDVKKLNWDEFFQSYFRGLRTYIFKESDDTIETARIKYKRLYWIHQTTKGVLIIVILSLIWFLVNMLCGKIF